MRTYFFINTYCIYIYVFFTAQKPYVIKVYIDYINIYTVYIVYIYCMCTVYIYIYTYTVRLLPGSNGWPPAGPRSAAGGDPGLGADEPLFVGSCRYGCGDDGDGASTITNIMVPYSS